MSIEHLLAVLAYAFAMSATPGPNNAMVLASGANFGVRRTVPHMFGIVLGFGAMFVAVGLGLGALLEGVPALALGLKAAGVGYMLWLAWRIATAAAPGEGAAGAKPLTVIAAAAFQWVNPKGWAAAITGVAAYTIPERYGQSLAVLTAMFMALSLPVSLAWAGFGVTLRRLLAAPGRLRVFNVTMAVLLIASLWPLLADVWHVRR